MMQRFTCHDCLYGVFSYESVYTKLIQSPVFQRLRHIRLSNIDSINMPGIANLSRFEHALGVGYLATQTRLYRSLPRFEQIAFTGAALLHDWAITAFGHLVEEAFRYTKNQFDHEHKLRELLVPDQTPDVGGADLQVLFGRQTQLRPWAEEAVGTAEADKLLQRIMTHIEGNEELGRLISGDMDLDNIDGVFRMALHMGLPAARDCPVSLARSMVGIHASGTPIFLASASDDLAQWVSTRHMVYKHLMLANDDFVGKLMLLYATVGAIEAGEIRAEDWHLTDEQLLQRLRESNLQHVKDATIRWLVGEPWHKTPLYWMRGSRPDFPRLLEFSGAISEALSRNVFVYGIKDKRHREVNVHYDDGTSARLGQASCQWLLGAGASERRPIKPAEVRSLLKLAEEAFESEVISRVPSSLAMDETGPASECLL